MSLDYRRRATVTSTMSAGRSHQQFGSSGDPETEQLGRAGVRHDPTRVVVKQALTGRAFRIQGEPHGPDVVSCVRGQTSDSVDAVSDPVQGAHGRWPVRRIPPSARRSVHGGPVGRARCRNSRRAGGALDPLGDKPAHVFVARHIPLVDRPLASTRHC